MPQNLAQWSARSCYPLTGAFVVVVPAEQEGVVPSVSGTAPHAKGIMIEIVQPQGNKLNLAFALSLAAGACVRVCLVRPPHAPSLRRCPQLSTLVRDHRGKSLCSKPAARLGGAGPWRFGWHLSLLRSRGPEGGTLAGSPQ